MVSFARLLPAAILLFGSMPVMAAPGTSPAVSAVPALQNSLIKPELNAPSGAPVIDPQSDGTGSAGDLMVAPTRVVLGGKVRATEMLVNNRGRKESTYRITLVHLKMDENGIYKEIPDDQLKASGVMLADPYLRYSPRQVTLKPGETQIVKIMVRPTENMAPGEYRSHLKFSGTPDASMGQDIEAAKTAPGQIAISVVPVYGITIPILIRQGNLEATAKLSKPVVTGNKMSLTVTRSGTRSVFGDITVTKAGSDKVVGQLKGVAVLTPNDRRNITLDLSPEAVGPLSVEYREKPEEGGAVLDSISVR